MADVMTYEEFTKLVDDGIVKDVVMDGNSLRVWLTDNYSIWPTTKKDWEHRACIQYFVKQAPIGTVLASRLVKSVEYIKVPEANYIGGMRIQPITLPSHSVIVNCRWDLVRESTISFMIPSLGYVEVSKEELVHEDVKNNEEHDSCLYSRGYKVTQVPKDKLEGYYNENR